MSDITRYISVSTTIEEAIAVAEAFGTTLFLGCDETVDGLGTIPIDRRIVEMARDEFADYLDPDSEEYRYATAYFGQSYKPNTIKIGRVVTADSYPYLVLTGGETDYTVFVTQTTAQLKFTDDSETPKTDQVEINFTGITSYAGMLAKINTAIAAVGTPNITGLASGSFGLDNFGRLYFTMGAGTAGSDAPVVSLTAATLDTGDVDLFSDTYLGDTQTAYGGSDAETLLEAFQACRAIDSEFYQVGVFHDFDGETVDVADSEYVALATYIGTLKSCMLDIVIYDDDAKDATVTDDLASDLYALGLDNVSWYYTSNKDECPDAANCGYVYPQKEGACSFAFNSLSLVTVSATDLTTSQISAIRGKGGNYIDSVSGVVFGFPGFVVSGKEKRLVFGAHWFDATVQTGVFNARIARRTPFAYDWPTFGIIEQILRQTATEASDREIIYPVDDPDFPMTISMPDPADITSAIKATHEFNYDIYEATVRSEILKWTIRGKFKL